MLRCGVGYGADAQGGLLRARVCDGGWLLGREGGLVTGSWWLVVALKLGALGLVARGGVVGGLLWGERGEAWWRAWRGGGWLGGRLGGGRGAVAGGDAWWQFTASGLLVGG